jgi:hypothetical protein
MNVYKAFVKLLKWEAQASKDIAAVIDPTWTEWVAYMDGRCGKLSGWNLLRAAMLPDISTESRTSEWRGQSPRMLTRLVDLYDSAFRDTEGRPRLQGPLLLLINKQIQE